MSLKYLNSQQIFIDSHNRESGTHADFTITVNLTNKEVDSVCLQRCTIKKTYYLIPEGRNTFTLKEGLQTAIISCPIGNYSATSFRTILQTLLNTNSPNGWIYTITLPNPAIQPSTGKYQYNVTGNGGIQPSFIFTTYLYEQFGFEENTTNTFENDTMTSVNVINFQNKDLLRIHSNIVTDLPNNVLQEVSGSSTPDFSSIKYECLDIEANTKPFNIKTNIFRFSILDEDNLAIDISLNVLYTLFFYKRNIIGDIASTTLIPFMQLMTLQNTPKSVINKNNQNNKEKKLTETKEEK